MVPTSTIRKINGSLMIVCLVLVVLLGYGIVRTRHTISTTGILEVTASEPNAAITISQANHAAAPVGIGNARIRLQPGDYLLGGNASGLSSTQIIHITAQHTNTVNLNLTKNSNSLPSVDNVGFVNMDVLISNGITLSQATAVKEQFFTYDTTAKVVSIDTASITPGAHNPDSYDPFTINFTGTIDSVPFRAVVAYQGYDNAQLTLFNPQTGAQLYIGPGLPAQL